MFETIKNLIRHSSTIILVAVSVGVAINYIEKNSESYDYIQHFGDVTTKTEYYYPEKIESYAFGVNKNDRAYDLNFVNGLYCRELKDHLLREYELVFVNGGTMIKFDFWNPIESYVMSRGNDGNGGMLTRINETAAIAIRDDVASGSSKYGAWSLDDGRPIVDSECYILTETTMYTRFFKHPKVSLSRSNTFRYYISGEG